jgi:hypothetical protein
MRGRKQKGRREAGLSQLETLRLERDQYFAMTGPPKR